LEKPEGKRPLEGQKYERTVMKSVFKKQERGIGWIDLPQNSNE
jgi:hypothetical protein